ncbi:hypothetical protein Pla86_01380 [Planctomycetes bacterium Pla86]|uniref:Uncharacterized protein n=1 Tax=Engelhardtia mirabilis TaxID=2528011 RepID=A0A518BDL9_9BACT|nr:hypothetical protein Pla133_01380 [Planctomycetes bacterium Pla133]QDU99401.1 hypothetical protein Pla86_01380 [Planctomycetes bacterium Pla86]
MTSESKEDTEPWIEDKGVEYAYAYDPDGVLMKSLGIRGIPHAVLVDPYGQIVWRGHPMTLDADAVAPLLADALETPMWEWPAEASRLRETIVAGKFGMAIKMAGEQQSEELRTKAPSMLRKLVDGKVAGFTAMIEDLDVNVAEASAGSVALAVEGLPEADKVASLRARLGNDEKLAAAKKVFARIDEIRAGMPDTREKALALDLEKLNGWIDELEATAEDFAEKAPGRAATSTVEDLDRLRNFIEKERAAQARDQGGSE